MEENSDESIEGHRDFGPAITRLMKKHTTEEAIKTRLLELETEGMSVAKHLHDLQEEFQLILLGNPFLRGFIEGHRKEKEKSEKKKEVEENAFVELDF